MAALLVPLIASAASSCPEKFSEFTAQFEHDKVFQHAHTRFPLAYSYVDSDTEPEPKEIAVMVDRNSLHKYPGIEFPSPATQRAVPLERKMSSLANDTEIVRFDKPDTGMYSVQFYFKRSGSCWQLVKVNNMSL